MKIFISHQRLDSALALRISTRLKEVHQIESYLDVIDPIAPGSGDTLADQIRERLGSCTQLLAVVSAATRMSWWVPWEIGVASEKNFPLATYAGSNEELPDFLRKWPYLTSNVDLDHYAAASKAAEQTIIALESHLGETVALQRSTKVFYQTLRARLGQ